MNSLIIYVRATGRLAHFQAVAFGVPLPTWWDDYDSGIHDYEVGMSSYLEADFGTDGLLTADAMSRYGIAADHVDYYLKDVDFAAQFDLATPLVDHYVRAESGVIDVSPPVLSDQRKYITLTHSFSAGIPSIIATMRLADGTVDTGSAANIRLTCNRGRVNLTGVMAAGVVTFAVAADIMPQDVIFTANDMLGAATAGTLVVDWYYIRYKSARTFFIPGVLSTSMGPAGDGVAVKFMIPGVVHYGALLEYQLPALTRVEISALVAPSGGPLTLRISENVGGGHHDATLPDGQTFTDSAGSMVSPLLSTSATPTSTISVAVIAANGAQDVNVTLFWE